MRFRTWALIALAIALVTVTGCASVRLGRASAPTPFPTKTLRPTFTNTPAQPTAVPVAWTPVEPPTATPVPPTPEPPTPVPPTPAPPTPERPTFTVVNATVNVRSGPGTNYAVVGQVRQGQQFEITGKNPAGDWWQFTFNGQPAWIIGRLVSTNAAGSVQVAANIPAPPPTPRPQPTPRPAPTQPPAPSYSFRAAEKTERLNTNELITVWCAVFNANRTAFVSGTLRVTRGGSPIAPDQPFQAVENRGDPGLGSEFIYNQNCKIEIRPPIEGVYTAYLVRGGTQDSEPINFTVSGETRTFILEWRQK
jgi:hypothetical protein